MCFENIVLKRTDRDGYEEGYLERFFDNNEDCIYEDNEDQGNRMRMVKEI